ncbi:MAG: CDP-6-deoxy-delta-3,4-glucoseen reductase [Burkholderiales bacterium]|nr:MAG: CDP-6-deoxy-delta-3,4-glucoseen reductase [Burkholderiales bacterium]
MAYSVTLRPSGRQFELDEAETVLDAALRQGVVLAYGCRDGACGSCKGRVLSGQIVQGPHQARALSGEEQRAGWALFCCATARSDLEIEARVIAGVADIPIRRMPCRIASIERPAPDVAVLELQLPGGERLQYLAGQYVELILRDGSRRSYSMASAPHLAERLELHVRHMPGGRFTDALFGVTEPAVKVRDILRLEGPMGTFFLREDDDRPIVFVASGTGFAPVKAMVEHAVHKDIRRPMSLYWGGRRPRDLYLRELAERWARELADFRFVPVVSDARPEDRWHGRDGFVHRAVMQDHPDLSGFQVYACGTPAMVDAARADFVARCGLPEDQFFADAFTAAADAA